MFETTLTIRFLSDWHVGSGLGNGAIADAVLARDVWGIPHIPGSAVKGALREGAWRLGLCEGAPCAKRLQEYLFGTAETSRLSNRPGVITISGGALPEDLQAWLKDQQPHVVTDVIGDMTVLRMRTSLDENRQVVPHSLRSIECGIPGLVFEAGLSADIPAEAEAWFRVYLAAICACVKSMGGDRGRGLGRCSIVPDYAPEGAPAMPADIPGALTSLIMAGVEK